MHRLNEPFRFVVKGLFFRLGGVLFDLVWDFVSDKN